MATWLMEWAAPSPGSDRSAVTRLPLVIALEESMKQLKIESGTTRSEVLEAKARIRLPVPVNDTKIDSFENGGQANTFTCPPICNRD